MVIEDNCTCRQAFIQISRQDLFARLRDTVEEIKEAFQRDLFFTQEPLMNIIYENYLATHLLPGTRKIIELNEVDWNLNGWLPDTYGQYQPDTGRIILNNDQWCRKSLVHEAIHSVSTFDIHDIIRYPSFIEGLTEFFTGFFLFKKFNCCYDAWKKNLYRYCNISYEPSAKTCYTFSRYVNIEHIMDFYFGNIGMSWDRKWRNLVANIPQINNKRFKDPRRGNVGSIIERFHRECIRYFGEDFSNLYYHEANHFDYALCI